MKQASTTATWIITATLCAQAGCSKPPTPSPAQTANTAPDMAPGTSDTTGAEDAEARKQARLERSRAMQELGPTQLRYLQHQQTHPSLYEVTTLPPALVQALGWSTPCVQTSLITRGSGTQQVAASRKATSTLDDKGRVVKLVEEVEAGDAKGSQTFTFSYDDQGRLSALEHLRQLTPQATATPTTERFFYDPEPGVFMASVRVTPTKAGALEERRIFARTTSERSTYTYLHRAASAPKPLNEIATTYRPNAQLLADTTFTTRQVYECAMAADTGRLAKCVVGDPEATRPDADPKRKRALGSERFQYDAQGHLTNYQRQRRGVLERMSAEYDAQGRLKTYSTTVVQANTAQRTTAEVFYRDGEAPNASQGPERIKLKRQNAKGVVAEETIGFTYCDAKK